MGVDFIDPSKGSYSISGFLDNVGQEVLLRSLKGSKVRFTRWNVPKLFLIDYADELFLIDYPDVSSVFRRQQFGTGMSSRRPTANLLGQNVPKLCS